MTIVTLVSGRGNAYPGALGTGLWYLVVLRQIRFYGIATCWRQGWVTRANVEVRLSNDTPPQQTTASRPAPERVPV
jgi:hypothetical protein